MTHTIPHKVIARRPSSSCRSERCAPKPRSSPTRCPPARSPRTTQIIAIYGKGGIGKSFTLANLSYMMAQQGKKVLLIGCDPKSDTTSAAVRRQGLPDHHRDLVEEEARRRGGAIGDVCFKRDGVYAMELGGPEVGRGCGGRGIIHGFERSRSSASTTGASTTCCSTSWATWSAAASACRSPATCARRSSSSAATTCSRCTSPTTCAGGRVLPQARRQRRRGRHGDQQGRRHRRGAAFADKPPASRCWPRSRPTTTSAARAPATKSSAARHAVGPLFEELATNVAEAPPVRPKPLTQDQLLGLFSAEVTVGRDVVLEPATQFDMCRQDRVVKPTLEVVYDAV
jgi:chlorophyllide a reductase subunit X